MAIHDHYLDKFSQRDLDLLVAGKSASSAENVDEYCLQYLSARYAANIEEAIDEDRSGFVRVAEINEFTSSIPEGWSLLQWLAYWANGDFFDYIYQFRNISYLVFDRLEIGDSLLQPIDQCLAKGNAQTCRGCQARK